MSPCETAGPRGVARRDLLKIPAALAAGSLAVPLLGGASQARAAEQAGGVTIVPKYFPLGDYEPEIDLRGKLAVITGASRGIGRAVGEALARLGAAVIGTSRRPKQVPTPPAFPILELDVTDPDSVGEFAQLLTMDDPDQNVVVASPREPWATQGANAIIESEIVAENRASAVPFTCG